MPRKVTSQKKKVRENDQTYKVPFYVYLPIIIGLGCLILTFTYISLISFDNW